MDQFDFETWKKFLCIQWRESGDSLKWTEAYRVAQKKGPVFENLAWTKYFS